MKLVVRPTGILLEQGNILLVKQKVTGTREWSLPGGRLEPAETIEQCLVREIKEETGLDVEVKELIYVTDRFTDSETHVVHMTFLVERTGEKPDESEWTHDDPAPSKSAARLREVRMVPIGELSNYGFVPGFCQLVKTGFPCKGSYQGDYQEFSGESG